MVWRCFRLVPPKATYLVFYLTCTSGPALHEDIKCGLITASQFLNLESYTYISFINIIRQRSSASLPRVQANTPQ